MIVTKEFGVAGYVLDEGSGVHLVKNYHYAMTAIQLEFEFLGLFPESIIPVHCLGGIWNQHRNLQPPIEDNICNAWRSGAFCLVTEAVEFLSCDKFIYSEDSTHMIYDTDAYSVILQCRIANKEQTFK